MTRTVIKLPLFLLFLIINPDLRGQNLHTYVDIDSLRVGDILHFTLVLDGNYTVAEFPDQNAFEPEFELLSRERFQISQQRDSLVYRLQFFGTESVTIGRKEVRLRAGDRDTLLYSVPVPLSFRSVLAEDETEFRPVKPIFDFARNWFPWILLFLLIAAAAWFFYKKYSEREPDETALPLHSPTPFLNPLDELQTSLSLLNGKKRPQSFDEFELFYIELGNAIRLYLKRVYNIQALEMTTREILENLRHELAPADIISITRQVLQDADMVKFANFLPGEELAISALEKADRFAETASVTDYERINYMRYKHQQEQQYNHPEGSST